MAAMEQMLRWPPPLKLRPLTEADIPGLSALIVSVLCEYQFSWLASAEQQEEARASKAASLRHSLALCVSDPARNAFWVLEDTTPGRQRPAGCVGIRPAAAP
eukprot:COSAG05_NODE_13545_length_426_cov_0.779817_1_plen_101_part_10